MNYKINWTQNYDAWAQYSQKLLEVQVDISEFKEAREVLARIMAL